MAIKGLKTRSITAVVFGLVVITMILASSYTSIILLGLIGMGCSMEYDRVSTGKNRYPIIIGLFLLGIISFHINGWPSLPPYFLFIPIIGHIILYVFLWDKEARFPHHSYSLLIILLYILIPILGMCQYVWNQDNGLWILLSIIILIWTSDTGAYITGNLLGKRKLMPRVSPNKSVEGFLGAGALSVIVGGVIYYFIPDKSITWWISFSGMVWLIGSLGDLVQSSIKRKYEVKDSGNLLPGHGGVWDRFDSFIMVLPMALIWIYYF